jgi:Protein of unknown function (DUF3565)
MHHAIIGYFKDATDHWVAKLDCGHNQQLQHNPPVSNNPWVVTQMGRDDKIGVILLCSKCIAGSALDRPFSSLFDKEAA